MALLRSDNVNLNATGFAVGTYTLSVKSGADAATHAVQFVVKSRAGGAGSGNRAFAQSGV